MQHTHLKNKRIIIIGGTSGIGFATAKMAVTAGAQVIITGRNKTKTEKAASSISSDVQAAVVNINDNNSVTTFFETVTDIDHIYIAAGSTKIISLLEGNLDESLIAFNERIYGSLRIVKAAVPKIKPEGSIVFTGGISTDRPIAGAWVSGIGTATAEQLAKVLLIEFPHIRFNAVSPGYTDTPMWDTVLGDNKTEVLSAIAASLPVKKIAPPENVASAVIFLMTNTSITGEVIHIDGGGRLI